MTTFVSRKFSLALATLALVISLSASLVSTAFAQQIETVTLTDKNVKAKSAEVILVRNPQTPNTVNLSLEIPFGQPVCTRYDTRIEFGPDPSCGYDVVFGYRRVCETIRTCEVTRNGVCQSYSSRVVCRDVPTQYTVMRACSHPETYCAETGVSSSLSTEKVVLDFSALGELTDGKEQRFRLIGSQARVGSSNDKYSVFVVDGAGEQIEISVKEFLGNDRVIFRSVN